MPTSRTPTISFGNGPLAGYDIVLDFKDLERQMTNLERQQIPFAAAQTATALARRTQMSEIAALGETFDKPTPFTNRAFGVLPARKDDGIAILFAKDIQAKYLKPFLDGGKQVLGNSRAILTPKGIALNQYGNIPRGKIAALKGKPNVFVGPVHTKSGQVISGVWERPVASGKNQHTGLKLLVRFTDPQPVKQRLPYFQRANEVVQQWGQAEADLAIARALATAR